MPKKEPVKTTLKQDHYTVYLRIPKELFLKLGWKLSQDVFLEPQGNGFVAKTLGAEIKTRQKFKSRVNE